MAVLVIADHDGKALKPGVTNTVTAATKIGGDVVALVAGKQCAEAAQAIAKVAGVKKVLLCEAPQYEGSAAENLAALVVGIAGQYSHILAPASAQGKNVAPRIAAATRSGASWTFDVRDEHGKSVKVCTWAEGQPLSCR